MYKKTFYKYKFGYINIDQENVYVTSTGNWSEITQLREKLPGKSSRKTGKVISIYIFMSVLILMTLGSFLFVEKHILLKLSMLAVEISGLLKLKKYFDTETGPRFYIPKARILDVIVEDERVLLKFKAIDDTPDNLILPKLEGNSTEFKNQVQAMVI